MMMARSAETAALLRERLFEPDIAKCKPGEPPTGPHQRFESWVWDKLAFCL
jgi:hypothetical protein